MFRRVLAGEQGPVRDAVLLNAAAALAAFDERPARLHDAVGGRAWRGPRPPSTTGGPAALLERWVQVSQAAASA